MSRLGSLLIALCLLVSMRAHAQDVLFNNSFEGLGIGLIADRVLLSGESLSVQAVGSPAALPATLTFSLTQAPSGASIDAQTGLISWTPTAAQAGDAAFGVKVTDQTGAFAATGFRATVIGTNRGPVLDGVPDQRLRVGATLALTLSASDPDAGDTLSFARLAGPTALTVAANGALGWTPTAADVGEALVRVGVVDTLGEADVTTFRVRVDRANQAPQIAALPDRVATVGRALALTVVASDPDVGDSLAYALELAPAGATIGATSGAFAFTPNAAQVGRHRVRVVVTDTPGDTASAEFDLDVIAGAVPTARDDDYAVTAGSTLSVPAPGVLGNDSDANADPMTATLAGGAGNGALSLQADGSFTYTPSAAAKSAKSTPVLSVDFESGIPSSIAPGSSTLTGVQGFAGLGPAGNQFGGSFLRGGANSPVTVTLTNLPPHAAIELGFLLAIIDSWDGSGTFPAGDHVEVGVDGSTVFFESFANAIPSQIQTYSPPAGVTLARRADLGFGGPGSFFTDSAYDMSADPLFLEIPHSAPTLTLTLAMRVNNDQGVQDESWAIDNLRVALVTAPDQQVIDSFSYRANDVDGSSAPATARITVRPAVFPPRFLSQPPGSALHSVEYRYDALVLSAQAGEPLTFALDQAPAGASVDASGRVTWTPTEQQVGTHRLVLRVTDPRAASDTLVFTIAVTAPITVPDVVGQTQSTAQTVFTDRFLGIGTVRSVPSASIPVGRIAAQSPVGGTQVTRDTLVALDISTGPGPRPVPRLIGLTRAGAEAVLAASGFVPGTIAFATDAALPPGVVLQQAPPAANYAPPNSTVNLTLASGPPIRITLARERIAAGASLALTAQAYDADGAPATSPPAIAFSVTAVPGASAGAPPTIAGATLSSFASTRGSYRVRATRTDSGAFAEALLAVTAPLPDTPEFAAHARFNALLGVLPDRLRALRLAAQASDTAALAALRTELQSNIDALRADLELLRVAPITAPESGFFPSLAALPGAGFPETADDRAWLDTVTLANAQIEDATARLDAFGAGSGAADLDALRAIDAQLQSRVQRLATLAPTLYSAVSSNVQVTAFLNLRLPRLVLAELESLVRLLDASAPRAKFGFFLADAAAAASIRTDLMERQRDMTFPHVINSGAVLATAAVLRTLLGPTGGMDVITGSSLAIHVFRRPGSSLDGDFNPIAEMNEVLMIGPDVFAAVSDLFGTLRMPDAENPREVKEKFEEVRDAANNVAMAFEEANSTPDRAIQGCLLTDEDCVSLIWNEGFTSVNEGGELHLPGPVLILVRDVATGDVHATVAGFLGQPDPDVD